MEEVLAKEIVLASNNSMESHAIKKRWRSPQGKPIFKLDVSIFKLCSEPYISSLTTDSTNRENDDEQPRFVKYRTEALGKKFFK